MTFNIPNTYLINGRDYILSDIWTDLQPLGLLFLRVLSVNSYNCIGMFDHSVLTSSPLCSVLGGEGKTEEPQSGHGTQSGQGSHTTQNVQGSGFQPATQGSHPHGHHKHKPAHDKNSNLLLTCGAHKYFLRPFHVSEEFVENPKPNVELIPQLFVKYPASAVDNFTVYSTWLRQVLATFTKCGLFSSDEDYQLLTEKTDQDRLRRISTPYAVLRFHKNVPQAVRNACHSLLRNGLWFYSLSTDKMVDEPEYIFCTWKYASTRNRGVTGQ
jgi:hypothetical protein